MAAPIQRVYKARMSRTALIAIARIAACGLTIVLSATFDATSHAQDTHGGVPTGATRGRQSQAGESGTAQGPRTGASKSGKEPSTTNDPPLPEFQLILPDVPSCWSHARAENPQRSQKNGGLVEQRQPGFYHSNMPADPLLGPFTQTSGEGNVDHHDSTKAKK
jgi:hypothetical protein